MAYRSTEGNHLLRRRCSTNPRDVQADHFQFLRRNKINVFTCTTRLYKDAEQRFTQGGDSIVSFTGAVDAGFGEKKTTSWIKFNLWGKRGESLSPYLKDKTQVCVSGELANRKWQDKDGQDKYSLEVRVNEITLIGGKQEGQSQPQQSQPQRNAQGSTRSNDFDGDIPFGKRIDY